MPRPWQPSRWKSYHICTIVVLLLSTPRCFRFQMEATKQIELRLDFVKHHRPMVDALLVHQHVIFPRGALCLRPKSSPLAFGVCLLKLCLTLEMPCQIWDLVGSAHTAHLLITPVVELRVRLQEACTHWSSPVYRLPPRFLRKDRAYSTPIPRPCSSSGWFEPL